MPLTEILRILAWDKVIADKAGSELNVDEIVTDLGVSPEEWNNYLTEFKKFHKYI